MQTLLGGQLTAQMWRRDKAGVRCLEQDTVCSEGFPFSMSSVLKCLYMNIQEGKFQVDHDFEIL